MLRVMDAVDLSVLYIVNNIIIYVCNTQSAIKLVVFSLYSLKSNLTYMITDFHINLNIFSP